MPGHEQDIVFIVWAYIGAAVVTLGLVAGTIARARRAKARLAALEAQGIRRRSAS